MTDHNTMPMDLFFFDHFFWVFIQMLWFQIRLFYKPPYLTFEKTQILFLAIIFVSVTAGILMTRKHRRNSTSVFVNTVTPFVICTAALYWQPYPMLFWTLSALAALFALLYFFLVMKRKPQTGELTMQMLKRKLRWAFLGARTVAVSILTMSICILMILAFFGRITYSRAIRKEPAQSKEELITAHSDILSNLCDEAWRQLSDEEKLKTLQTVADIEAASFGLPFETPVTVRKLRGYSEIANYSDTTRRITVNQSYFHDESSYEMLDSICHEARHAYQHRLCEVYIGVEDEQKDLLMFDGIRKMSTEYAHYKSGNNDFDEYYEQIVEQDARAYAKAAIRVYCDQLGFKLLHEDRDEENGTFIVSDPIAAVMRAP